MTGRGTGPTVRRVLAAVAVLAAVSPAATSCAGGPPTVPPSGVDELQIPTPSADPRDFVDGVDNRWFPLEPGTTWTYRTTGDGGDRTEVVSVTDRTKVVQGVTTTVVRDVTAGDNGKVVSETFDWYAQDVAGNVWKFGADVTAHHHGRSDTTGSWEAGVHGAEAGLMMAAHPRVGDGYLQERAPGVAEDQSEVLSITEQRSVPLDDYEDLVETEDTSALEPALEQRKYYAPGVGLVYAETIGGGNLSVQLVGLTRG